MSDQAKTYETTCVGIANAHQEGDAFILNEEPYYLCLASVLERAGVEVTGLGEDTAFEYAGTELDDEDTCWEFSHKRLAEAYRERTGREWPQVYRVSIKVTAEPLSDAETAAWWKARRER